jgi:preprotein translocase subunit YajC
MEDEMDSKTAKQVKVGDRVRFSDGVCGTVRDMGYNAVEIKWDDGQQGVIHHDDMQDVSKSDLPGSSPRRAGVSAPNLPC